MDVSSHTTELPDAAEAPPWVHLLPAGVFSGVDGRGPYTLANAQGVIDASMRAGRLPIDENHATDAALKSGGPAPAVGWITAMDARADGIWGQVEWTRAGQALLGDRAYRQISPAFGHTADKRVTRVVRASLTNAGNLPLATLHHTQDDGMDLVKLRAALGLPAEADEAAILQAATAAAAAISTHAQQLGAIAAAAGVAAGANAETIATALHTTLQAGRATVGEAQRMAGELVSLQTQLTTLANERLRERAAAAVAQAQKDGKPIPPVLVEHYIARHMADPAAVEREFAALPSLHTSNFPVAGGVVPPGDGLSAEDRDVCRIMGTDPKKFLETKRARLGLAA